MNSSSSPSGGNFVSGVEEDLQVAEHEDDVEENAEELEKLME